ncbi:MAG: hypothetical protein ACFCD0_04390 [Gemmataceae bacterium]
MPLNLFGQQPKKDPNRTKTIRNWVSTSLGLDEDVTVMITELECTEEGCPPLETVIAILDNPGNPKQFKIHKPISEVTQEDVVKVVNSESQCSSHKSTDKE